MTSNHILLCRLAELMLEHEQHILPVDVIFDDVEIGEFVKSIQIDSPYQQMLFEGVLTETVRDEKLYVSFTVEGYFHYVLGEVILGKTEGKGPEELKHIVEGSKLNGVKKGVEQCLIRNVNKGDWDRVIKLVDMEGDVVNCCIVPFTSALLIVNDKTPKDNDRALFQHVELILSMILKRQTAAVIALLDASISQLQSLSRFKLVEHVYKAAQNLIELQDLKSAGFLLETLSYFERNNSKVKLKEIETYIINQQNSESGKCIGFLKLANFYSNKLNYKKALKYYKKAKKLNIHSEAGYIDEGISTISLNKELFDDALLFAEFALASRLSEFGFFSFQVADSFFLMGRIWDSFGYENNLSRGGRDQCFQKALDSYDKCINIRKIMLGIYHEDVASVYQAIGNTLKCSLRYIEASDYLLLALQIQKIIRGEKAFIVADIKSDIADIYLNLKRNKDAVILLQESYDIFRNLGKKNIFAVSVLEMLEKARNDC